MTVPVHLDQTEPINLNLPYYRVFFIDADNIFEIEYCVVQILTIFKQNSITI